MEFRVRKLSLHSRSWAGEDRAFSTQMALGVEGREKSSLWVFELLYPSRPGPAPEGERDHFFGQNAACGHTHQSGEMGNAV